MLLSDIRITLRSLLARPLFVAMVVATLALGIGANTAIFGVVNAVLIRPLPFVDSDRLVVVEESNLEQGRREEVSAPTFRDWQQHSRAFTDLAAWIWWGYALTGAGEPRELDVVRVSSNFFRTLGIEPVLGRGFLPEEEQIGREQVVVLSSGFWRQQLGSDPAIIGQSLTLDGRPYTIVGVMPDGFQFPDDPAIAAWVPLGFDEGEASSRNRRMFNVVGRLDDGVDLDEAELDMSRIAALLAAAYPANNAGWGVTLTPAREALVGSQRPLLILLAAVSLVLLIACVNIINLLLVRGADRRKEVAIRMALGASSRDIIGQLTIESLFLGVMGAAAGLVLASWILQLVLSIDPGMLPNWNPVTLDLTVGAFATVLGIGSAIVASLLPARQTLSTDVTSALKDGGAVSAGRGRFRLRHSLAVAEIALAFVLAVGAGLLVHSLYRLRQVDPGFRPEKLLVTSVSLAETRYPDDSRQHAFFAALLERLESHPDIIAAALVTTLPMSPAGIDHDMPYKVEGVPVSSSGPQPEADFRIASAGYFATLGVPISQGREFSSRDRPDAPPVMVVNQTMARLAFPDGRVLDRTVTTGGRSFQVVGVAADVHHRSRDAQVRPEMFVHLPQIYSYGYMNLAVRTRGEPLQVADAIKREVRTLDPDQPIGVITTMPDLLSASEGRRRFTLILLLAFAAVGLTLAAIGVYGVVAYTVEQRTREIGIRLALGAVPGELMGSVLISGLRLALMGVGIGMLGAAVLTRLLRSQLFELSPLDPLSFGATGFLIAIIALLATWFPARRTLKVDPLTALRHE